VKKLEKYYAEMTFYQIGHCTAYKCLVFIYL